MSFISFADHQLMVFFLDMLITFPKLVSNNQLLFPNDNSENISKNQYLAPADFYQIQNTTKSKQLYLLLNIPSISYQTDDFASLIKNCKTKLKVINVSECRVRTGRFSL